MTEIARTRIGYLLKRYPRLSETFVLNEIRGLERLGVKLHLFSLMRPDESPVHPSVAEVQSPVTYFPEHWLTRFLSIVAAHLTLAIALPIRYMHAVALAVWWSIGSDKPFSVLKHFLRSAYVASGCRRLGLQHLHAHFAHGPATVAHFASVILGIPFSFTTHAKDLYLTRRVTLRRRVRHAKFVVTCTRYNVEYLQNFIPQEDRAKIHLVYHGVDLAEFPVPVTVASGALGGKADGCPLILAVGRLVPKKGLGDLVAACRLLSDRGLDFRCAIVGSGPLRRELEAAVNELGLHDAVSFHGPMAHDRLVSLYGHASLFALSPHIAEDGDRDGIPNVLVEAMAAGVPVVSTFVSGIPELIDDGQTGLLVNPRDPTALADAIGRLLCDPATRRAFAATARKKVEVDFNCWETAKVVRSLLLGDDATAGASGWGEPGARSVRMQT